MTRVEYKNFECRCGKRLRAPKNPSYDSEKVHTVDIKCPRCKVVYFYNFKRNEFVDVS